MNYTDEIWIDCDDGTKVLWRRLIVDDSYASEVSSWLRAHWGERVGETIWGARLVEIAPDYIQDMRGCLSQYEFTEWYLWKFHAPRPVQEIVLSDLQTEQLSLLVD